MKFEEIISNLPKAYYQDDSVYIIHADCRDVLPLIPDKSIDLVLTDPPYGLNSKMNGGSWGNTKTAPEAFHWDILVDIDLLMRLVSIGMEIIVWGGHYYSLPSSRRWLVWEKSQRMYSVADCELAWTNLDKPSKSWLDDRRPDGCNYHPTQKPIALLEWCIKQSSSTGGITFDPFLGSGTTAVAAKKLGRKCIGIEIEEKYCEIAAKRCSQSVMNLEIPKETEAEQTFINFDKLPPNP